MVQIRAVAASDIDALYAISLATGIDGEDAFGLYEDGRMVGHLYSAPYALLEPRAAFVAEDDEGVGGFIVGTFDTQGFDATLERDWWPSLRIRYADPAGDPANWTADQGRAHRIHHPQSLPEAFTARFPAHIHMNLLPRLQGRGLGAALLQRWLEHARAAGVPGVYLGTSLDNARAQRFWQSQGFRPTRIQHCRIGRDGSC